MYLVEALYASHTALGVCALVKVTWVEQADGDNS